jgi:hypothetical protein
MKVSGLLAAAALAFAAPAAAQQPSTKDVFKGKVKPGMYETRVVTDMSGVPGIPPDQAKNTETHKRCMTAEEVERGLKSREDCKAKTFNQSATGVHFVSECKDGSLNDLRIAFSAAGFSSEMKTTGKHEGKPFVMMMKSESKYLGPCKG